MFEKLVWLYNIYRVHGVYKQLLFYKREAFMRELRPILEGNARIAYPDALFFIEDKDIKRAMKEVS